MVKARNGVPVAVACLLGRLFMKPVDSPWQAADRVLAAMPSDVRVRLIDFHAEATSDMQLMGRYLDGRVTAVLGTHTHVPTADECILPGGTAFQCDVGMTGPFDSIIGRRIDRVMETTLTGLPTEFDVATGDVRLCGVDRRGRPRDRPGNRHRAVVCQGVGVPGLVSRRMSIQASMKWSEYTGLAVDSGESAYSNSL